MASANKMQVQDDLAAEIYAREASPIEALTRGEIDMQVSTAKRFPRSIAKFKLDAETMATLDQETAESCFYVLKRDGQVIEGPGVRLAEIVASCWGNLRCEARIVAEGDRFVTAQGTAWDIEKNVLVRMETQRRITKRDGRRYSDDMIVTTGNAAAAIAFRNAVFKVIPSAFVRSIYESARRTAIGDQKTLAHRRQAAFAWFTKAGVSEERVLAYVNKRGLDDITIEDLVVLTGTKTAIVEGTSKIDDVFPPDAPKEGTHAFGFNGQQPKQEQKPETQQEPAPAPEQSDLVKALAETIRQNEAKAAAEAANEKPPEPVVEDKGDGKTREQREAEFKARSKKKVEE